MDNFFIWLIFGLIVFFVGRWLYRHRLPATNTVDIITGAVKVGKSSFSVWYCITYHIRALLSVRFYNLFHKEKKEIPYLYCNVPLRYKYYRKLTKDLIQRKARFTYGSICYIQEASLFADQYLFKDIELNEVISQFVKLFGHELHGGKLICDTQNMDDLHFGFKRGSNSYLFLEENRHFLGLLIRHRRIVLSVQQGLNVNTFDGKQDEKNECWIPWLVWKIFDAYCYSSLTDWLPISCEKGGNTLKVDEIVSFNPRTELLTEKLKAQKNNAIKDDLRRL